MTPQNRKLSILIADDDARVRHALRALIEAQPDLIVAAEASSSFEVRECDERLAPSVILLDLVLASEGDGLELLQLLAGTRKRCVVAISVHSGLFEAALKAGARVFVDKGASPDRILEALRLAAKPTSCGLDA